jgi:hypothetical protein
MMLLIRCRHFLPVDRVKLEIGAGGEVYNLNLRRRVVAADPPPVFANPHGHPTTRPSTHQCARVDAASWGRRRYRRSILSRHPAPCPWSATPPPRARGCSATAPVAPPKMAPATEPTGPAIAPAAAAAAAPPAAPSITCATCFRLAKRPSDALLLFFILSSCYDTGSRKVTVAS